MGPTDKTKDLEITMSHVKIKCGSDLKLLGLTINQNLDFSTHVSEATSRKESGCYRKTTQYIFCQSQTYYIQVCHTASADVLSYRLAFLSLFGQQETRASPRKSLGSNV